MSTIGIDPGLDGGLCWMTRDGTPHLRTMPTLEARTGRVLNGAESASWFRAMQATALGQGDPIRLVVLETCSTLRPPPGLPVAALGGWISRAHKLGRQIGFWEGLIWSFGWSMEAVPAARWHKAILGSTKTNKDEAIRKAHELFPGADLRRTPKCSKAHDGLADALLLSEYGRRLAHA